MSKGISHNQEAILRWMQRNAGQVATATGLQDVVPTSRPSLSRALQSLEKRGLVRKLGAGGYRLYSSENPVDGVFVGRQRELGELTAMLQDALSGRGHLIMLVGEPGIGKTRIARELAVNATQSGALVLWGRCHSAQGVPPYWPWVQTIRQYVLACGPEQLRSQMGAGAADIAEIVPEIRERLPDLKPPPPLDNPEQARFRLFDSVTRFLKAASQTHPLLLVLEDLHWADKPSLLLLEFLSQELGDSPLLLVSTYRDTELTRQHPLSQTLGELAREPLFRRVPLRGLSEEEVGRYIEATSGITPHRGLVKAVHTQTEGNPLFMTQVVELLGREGGLTPRQVEGDQNWSIRIPAGVHEAIGKRLDLLSGGCNEVLTLASVVGRDFEMRLLERLVEERPHGGLLEALEEALAARVIEEFSPPAGRYRFTHVLIQETLARELSTVRRALLHQRIGEALEELYGADAEAHAAALAYHFAEAMAVMGAEKVVRYSLLAGEQALAIYAWEEALDHFQRGLAATEGLPMDPEKAALLFGLGRAQAATLEVQQHEEMVASLSHAFDFYAATNDVARAVAVATYPLPSIVMGRLGVAQFISRALALVPPDSHEAGRLLSNYCMVLGLAKGDYPGAQAALDRALFIAQREGDVALELRTLSWGTVLDLFNHCYEEGLNKSLRAIEVARYADDPVAEANAHIYAVYHLIIIGTPQPAHAHAAAALQVAEKLRDQFTLAHALWANELLFHSKGDWRAALEYSDRGLAVLSMDTRLLSSRIPMDCELGDFGQGEAHLERYLDFMGLADIGFSNMHHAFLALAIPVISRITGDTNQFHVAKAAAESVLSSPTVIPYFISASRVGLALMAVRQDDVVAAGEQYGALKSRRGTLMAGKISTDRVLGLLAQTIGDLDQAAAHFEDALAFCRKAGPQPELAWSCCDYADALLQRNQPGDPGEATSLLEESLSIASELGMKPLMERVATRLDQVGAPPAPAYPDGLTHREVDVLCLIAAGKRNRQIGEALFISLNTVANHITSIFNKTACANLAEATAYAYRHRLVI